MSSNPHNSLPTPSRTDAAAANVFLDDGTAIIISIAWTKVTRRIARCEIVRNRSSAAQMAAVYLAPSAAMACTIVQISATKTIAM